MRGIITCSGLLVCTALIVLIHAVLTGDNIRRAEVNQGLDTAMDYAYECMRDVYADIDFASYDSSQRDGVVTELMGEFCRVLNEKTKSDSDIEVRLIYADIEKGLFQIGVKGEYDNPIGDNKKSVYYEKTYSFN